MCIEIVDLNDSYLGECADLFVETFNSEPWNDRWDYGSALARLKDIFNTPGFFGLILLDDGIIVAAALGNLEHFYTGSIYNLKEMFVKQQLRGRKLGSLLLRNINDQLTSKGTKSIWLSTTKGDMTEKFYLKNGFSEVNEMITMSKNLYEDTITGGKTNSHWKHLRIGHAGRDSLQSPGRRSRRQESGLYRHRD